MLFPSYRLADLAGEIAVCAHGPQYFSGDSVDKAGRPLRLMNKTLIRDYMPVMRKPLAAKMAGK